MKILTKKLFFLGFLGWIIFSSVSIFSADEELDAESKEVVCNGVEDLSFPYALTQLMAGRIRPDQSFRITRASQMNSKPILNGFVTKGFTMAAGCDNVNPLIRFMDCDYVGAEALKDILTRVRVGDLTRVRDSAGASLLHHATSRNIEIIEFLIEITDGCIKDTGDRTGKTALMDAAARGRSDVVKLLLQKGISEASATDAYGATAVMYAANAGHLGVVQFLCQEDGVDSDEKNVSSRTVVMFAAMRGHLDVVRYLYEECGVNVKRRDIDNTSPFSLALTKGHLEVAHYLADLYDENKLIDMATESVGTWVGDENESRRRAFCAIKFLTNSFQGDRIDEVIKAIIQHERSGHLIEELLRYPDHRNRVVNWRDEEGNTVVHIAAMNGDSRLVKHFAEKENIETDFRNVSAQTPLMISAFRGDRDSATSLIGNGADLGAKDCNGKSVAEYAMDGENLAVIAHLLRESSGDFFDTKEGDFVIRELQFLTGKMSELDLNFHEINCASLSLAVHYSEEAASYLLEKLKRLRYHLHFKQIFETIFRHAVCLDNFSLVQILNERFHDNVKNNSFVDEHNRTLLKILAENNFPVSTNMVRYLLEECDYATNMARREMEIMFLQAAENGHTGVVKYLLAGKEFGVDVEAKDLHGQTALMNAAMQGRTDVVEYLVGECDADVSAKNYKDGRTALILAAAGGHADVVRLLVGKFDADVSAKDKYGEAALITATKGGHLGIVRCLLVHGAGVDIVNNVGRTALMYAAARGHENVVSCLLEHNPDLNIQGEDGETVLHKAMEASQIEILELLLEHNRAGMKSRNVTIFNTASVATVMVLGIVLTAFFARKSEKIRFVSEKLYSGLLRAIQA